VPVILEQRLRRIRDFDGHRRRHRHFHTAEMLERLRRLGLTSLKLNLP